LYISDDFSFGALVLTHSVTVLTFFAAPSSLLNAVGKFQQTSSLLSNSAKSLKPPIEFTFDFEVRETCWRAKQFVVLLFYSFFYYSLFYYCYFILRDIFTLFFIDQNMEMTPLEADFVNNSIPLNEKWNEALKTDSMVNFEFSVL
jgi:hypothetical protein